MKRIKTKEDIERGKKRFKIIGGVVLITLMVFSTAGFALLGGGQTLGGSQSGSENEPFYNGQYWIYQLGEQQYYFANSLEETSNVPVSVHSGLNNYAGLPLFIVSNNDAVSDEISVNLGRYASRAQRACFGECEEDLPEKDCTENLIVYEESEENSVRQEDNCVFIEGDLLAVDAFLYRTLGLE
jgi:hypothetical protein